jgi:selenocysteine-specific elongation factor
MPREELRSRMKAEWNVHPRLFNLAMRRLVAAELAEESGALVRLPGHSIRFSSQQQAKVDALLRRFAASPYNTPSVKECQAEVGEDIYEALILQGALKSVSPDVVFRQVDYERMVAEIKDLLKKQGTLTAAQVRDHFNNSRKYVLALLEHLDAIGVTAREGDVRRLRSS